MHKLLSDRRHRHNIPTNYLTES